MTTVEPCRFCNTHSCYHGGHPCPERAAYNLGVQHATAAASWTCDGNTTQEHIRRVLGMLDEGDPQADDYLPPAPNLSGENADDLNPQGLAVEVLGERWAQGSDHEMCDAVADAYEAGVSETFTLACEQELRNHLDTQPEN